MKLCAKCKETLDELEFIHDVRTRDGYAKVCINCKAATAGLSRREYEFRFLFVRPCHFESWTKHKISRQAYHKKYAAANKEKFKNYSRKYHQANPHIVHEANHKRKARKSLTTENIFTEQDRVALIEEYRGCCAYCGKNTDKLEMDHIIPLCLGGKHTKLNIVPACFRCNRHKGRRTPEEAGMSITKIEFGDNNDHY